ncbi:MAG: phage minor head protein [Spirochaetales bacterium]|jgi:uncharacterized protein with gpF-like domain|nr:phage minor head protein [Spirochaetales bacterium]
MPPSAKYMNLPFDEAITFFRDKLSLPTETWKDIWKAMHARAFVVAGAMKEDLIQDLRNAVEKGIADGTTLTEFRKDFDNTIEKSGWKYKGGKAWRTAVIFNTNMSTAYAIGNYQQMMDPAVLKVRPYLRYVGSSAANPRAEHQKWANIILPADDPWWNTHYPPNGWGCKCGVVSHSAREVERITKEEANGPNPVQKKAPKIQRYEWLDKDTGKTHMIPKGIDPGWDYNVGRSGFKQ